MTSLRTIVKNWSQRSANHALPKIAHSNYKLLSIAWLALLIGTAIYTTINIARDIHTYLQHNSNTNINLTTEIDAKLPTISICADDDLTDTNVSINLKECHLKRRRYLEAEECDKINFYKSPNGCITFDNTLSILDGDGVLRISSEDSNVGLKLVFISNNLSRLDGIFAYPHDKSYLALTPKFDRHYMGLFGCRKGNTKIWDTTISYRITRRFINYRIPDPPYSDCTDDWTRIDSRILKEIRKTMNDLQRQYNEEACQMACSKVITNDTEVCSSLCPIKCTSTVYLINESIRCVESKNGIDTSTIHLSYAFVTYLYIEEIPAFTFRNLMGSIGGRLSLFLGMSLISFIDLIECFSVILFVVVKRRGASHTVPIGWFDDDDDDTPTVSTDSAPSFPASIKSKVNEWCLNSNIHGVALIARSKHKLIKLASFFGLTAALVYCFIIFQNNLSIYLSYEVYSKYNIERSLKTNFPVMTFCLPRVYDNENSIFTEKYCYDGDDDTKPMVDYRTIVDENRTICYTFNIFDENDQDHNETFSASFDGISSGCSFVLNASYALLFINNQSSQPSQSRFINVSRGEEQIIGIRIQYRYLLSKPYSNCVTSWELIDKEIYHHYKSKPVLNQIDFSYTEEACFSACNHYYVTRSCNHTAYVDLSNDIEFYNGPCYNQLSYQPEFIKRCNLKCPKSCVDTNYRITYSRYSLPMHLIKVFIYFDDTSYSEIIDIPKISFNDLLASIGGQFGLCIGISILSLVDFCVLVMTLLLVILKKLLITPKTHFM